MDPDDLEMMSRQQALDSRNYEYWQHPQAREQESLALLNGMGGQTDGYGLSVPEQSGNREFNRLVTGSGLTPPEQRYVNTREAMLNASRSNQDASFEQRQLQQPTRAPVMKFSPTTVTGNFNPRHGQAIAFAKALGFGQQISSSPQNAEIAYQAMTAMLRRVPLPVLLNPRRKPQTQAEFQALLEQLSRPQQPMSSSRPPLQPT